MTYSTPQSVCLNDPRVCRNELTQALNALLADTFTIYLMSRNYHWNVSCPRHQALHSLFEEHYKELSESMEEIAMRIRALGGLAVATFREFQALSRISEVPEHTQSEAIVAHASVAHQEAMRTAQTAVRFARALNDPATADLLSELISMHERCARVLGTYTPSLN